MAEFNSKQPREKITLETDVPILPKRLLPAPNRKELEEKISLLEHDIEQIRQSQQQTQNTIREKSGKNGQGQNSNAEIKQNIVEKRKLHEEREKQRNHLEELRDSFRKMVTEQKELRLKIKYLNEEDLNKAINDINRRMETTSLSLQEEKKLYNEMKELDQQKPLASQYQKNQIKLDENKQQQEHLKTKITDLWKQIDAIQERINYNQQTVNDKQNQSEIPQLKDKIKQWQQQIDDLYQQKYQLIQQFKEKEQNYKQQQYLVQRHKFIVDKKKILQEKARRKKNWEERQNELSKLHPWQYQIDACNSLIAYCKKISPTTLNVMDELKVLENDQLKNEEFGTRVLSKNEIENQELAEAGWGKKSKKKNKNKIKQPQACQLNHDIEILKIFHQIDVQAPKHTEEIDQLIQTLQEKKAFFESNPEKKHIKAVAKSTEIKQINEVNFENFNPNEFPNL